jgi:hypothetical protein
MDNKIQSLRAREVEATIDDLNLYLEGYVTAEGLVDTLQDMIKFLNQFIFENKTDNFDLRKFLTENKLTSNSRVLKEAVMWNWDGDRNSLEEVPPKFKAAVKSELPKLSGEKFEAFFDAVKNSFADEAGRGSMKFTSDQWADIIKDDSSKGRRSGLDPDYDKGGKYYSEEGAEAFRIQPFKVNDIEYTQDQAVRQGKYIVGLEGEELKKFLSDYMAAWKEDVGDTPEGKTFK